MYSKKPTSQSGLKWVKFDDSCFAKSSQMWLAILPSRTSLLNLEHISAGESFTLCYLHSGSFLPNSKNIYSASQNQLHCRVSLSGEVTSLSGEFTTS